MIVMNGSWFTSLCCIVCVANMHHCVVVELQIQKRDYGEDRTLGCELLPSTRHDQVAQALGAHGEHVAPPLSAGGSGSQEARAAVLAALERAGTSGKPAVVDVAMTQQAAPTIRLPKGRLVAPKVAGKL